MVTLYTYTTGCGCAVDIEKGDIVGVVGERLVDAWSTRVDDFGESVKGGG